MKFNLIKFIIAICSFLVSPFISNAQSEQYPPLPDFVIENKEGFNIITFFNTYENGVKQITIQRSADSNVNFTTIGRVPQTKKGNAAFVDAHPLLGKNWYQVTMEFTSGIDFKSNLKSFIVDSAMLSQQKIVTQQEVLQEVANKAAEQSKSVVNAVETQVQEVKIPKSKYVFTNPFNGNINIELYDAYTKSYKIEFYDSNKKKVFTIPRVNEKIIILDKRNFNQNGIYSFKIITNGTIFEEGFISIF